MPNQFASPKSLYKELALLWTMKERMFISILVILILMLLVSCGPRANAGDQPLETEAALLAASTGTQGVVTSLQSNYPPNLVYDQNELIALVEVANKGNFNLEPQDCFVEITGFDSNIISGDFSRPISCAYTMRELEGKSVYNTEGTSNQLEFRSQSINLPDGVPEYSPTLNILTCYYYLTKASPSVCIDPAFFQVTSEQKSCRPANVIMGAGQGGPVGVSYVGVNMAGSKAIFEINVKNFGTGRVLSPDSDILYCGQDMLEYEDLDRVGYNARISSGGYLNCRPTDGFVRLNNGQGKIICDYESNEHAAFETPLMIELEYNYIDSFIKEIKIIKTPGND